MEKLYWRMQMLTEGLTRNFLLLTLLVYEIEREKKFCSWCVCRQQMTPNYLSSVQHTPQLNLVECFRVLCFYTHNEQNKKKILPKNILSFTAYHRAVSFFFFSLNTIKNSIITLSEFSDGNIIWNNYIVVSAFLFLCCNKKFRLWLLYNEWNITWNAIRL